MICPLCEQEKGTFFVDDICIDCFGHSVLNPCEQPEEIICSDFEASLADESGEPLEE